MLFSHILVTTTLKLKAATIFFAVKKEAKQNSSKGNQGLWFLPFICKIRKDNIYRVLLSDQRQPSNN